MRILSVIACAGLVMGTAAVAKEPAQDKMVCKRVQDPDTGSHFRSSKRICMLQSEWKEIEDGTERAMQLGRDRSAVELKPQGMGSSPQ